MLPLIAGWLLAGLAALAGAWPVAAEGPGVIAGRLVNGTAGGVVPAGAVVTLYTFRGREYQAEQTAKSDDQGGFRFTGLDTGEELTHYLTAAHAGITYTAEPVKLTAEAPNRQIEL